MSNDLTPEAIRALRDRLGPTQAKFAARIGCHVRTVSKWERGIEQPRGLYAAALRRLMEQSDDEEEDNAR